MSALNNYVSAYIDKEKIKSTEVLTKYISPK